MEEWLMQKSECRDKRSKKKVYPSGSFENKNHHNLHVRNTFRNAKKRSWKRTRSMNNSSLSRHDYDAFRKGATTKMSKIITSGKSNKKGDPFYLSDKLFGKNIVTNLIYRLEYDKENILDMLGKLNRNEKGKLINVLKNKFSDIPKNFFSKDLTSQECFDDLEKYTYPGFIQIIVKKILRNRNKYIINE